MVSSGGVSPPNRRNAVQVMPTVGGKTTYDNTPPLGPIFKSRVLRTKFDSHTKRYAFGTASARSFRRRCVRDRHSLVLGWRSNRALNSVLGGAFLCELWYGGKYKESRHHTAGDGFFVALA